jgi:2-(1,2-epoxy-1,2-dihydrophenyl)acetyl-CoA isomerase
MSHIVTSVAGAVGVITIDRAARFNSLDAGTARDLRRAGILFARDENIRAVVLRGAPGAFCSGADLKTIRAAGAPYGNAFQEILEYIHSTISEIRRAPKPFIAAVDGIAAAGGFGLAMCCDLVVASERASFEWAYAKTGLTGAESSTFILPRLLGFRRAMDMLFLNPRLDARAALEWGLVSAVHPVEGFDGEVMALAERLAAGPTQALGIAKDLMNQAAGMDRLDYHLDREIDQLSRIADGRNFDEGIRAFFEKRAPVFLEK